MEAALMEVGFSGGGSFLSQFLCVPACLCSVEFRKVQNTQKQNTLLQI
jgi:hypothetical protein